MADVTQVSKLDSRGEVAVDERREPHLAMNPPHPPKADPPRAGAGRPGSVRSMTRQAAASVWSLGM